MLRYFRPVGLLPKRLLSARLLFAGLLTVAALALSALPMLTGNTASAQTPGDIELLSTEVTSEFQEGIRFAVEVRSAVEIDEIAVRFRIGQRDIAAYEYLEVEAQDGDSVSASGFYRTNTAARYIAPGTIITHHFEVTDIAGTRLETPESEYIYHDDRFEWDEITNGIVTVSYHGPVSFRAQDILDASVQTLEIMGPLLGAGVDDPIRITMYNNWTEMRPALPPASEATRRELITEGQAHSPEGVLLVLGGANNASGVTSHEVTHILVHRAGEGSLGRVPSWLNEGLAEFGNIQPGTSYDNALAFAIERDRLLPITAMDAPPGESQDVIIFYGQARSIVQYMIFEYGPREDARAYGDHQERQEYAHRRAGSLRLNARRTGKRMARAARRGTSRIAGRGERAADALAHSKPDAAVHRRVTAAGRRRRDTCAGGSSNRTRTNGDPAADSRTRTHRTAHRSADNAAGNSTRRTSSRHGSNRP